jgi:hypothetical protein
MLRLVIRPVLTLSSLLQTFPIGGISEKRRVDPEIVSESATRLAQHREVKLLVIRVSDANASTEQDLSRTLSETAQSIGRRLRAQTMIDPQVSP